MNRALVLHYAWFGVRALGVLRPRVGPVFGVEGRAVALTVDDGPHPEWTPPLLDLLARHDIRATFFLIGDRVREHPDLARRIAGAGHLLGNHSMTHPHPFAALGTAALEAEVGGTQEAIQEATGVRPEVFRAPSGNWSPAVLRAAARHGLTPVDWAVNPSDWRRPGTGHIARVLSRTRPGRIMLCHDGGGDRSQTVAALAQALPRLLARGLTFATPEVRPRVRT
ncbi:polysaccharide deacetylase family protein [Dactylosporangium sp. McL0621]|uniref:polysaccharide deacetylase family protein n=1 Tax=Dactylosporangium sp. McL0621 TaxID=3415678 RepID=UPI003CFA3811